jgi:hypothetical protein
MTTEQLAVNKLSETVVAYQENPSPDKMDDLQQAAADFMLVFAKQGFTMFKIRLEVFDDFIEICLLGESNISKVTPKEKFRGYTYNELKKLGSGEHTLHRKRTIQQTSSAAVFAIGAELSRRGYDITFTLGNTRKVDMMCSIPDGKTFKIQVKGISDEWAFYIDKPFFDGATQKDLYLVVVLVPKEARNDLPFRFFILSHEEAQNQFKRNLYKKDGTLITKNFGLPFSSIKPYENKWETFPNSLLNH